jgi:hypothetical protein
MSPAELAARNNPSFEMLSDTGRALDAHVDRETGLEAAIGAALTGWLTERRTEAVLGAIDAAEGGDSQAVRGASAVTTARLASMAWIGPVAQVEVASLSWLGATIGAPFLMSTFTQRIGETIDSSPGPTTSHDERTEGNLHTVADTTSSSRTTVSGSTVTVDFESSQVSTTTDTTTGTVVARSNHVMRVHAEVNACPDTAGGVTLKLSIDLSASADGSGGGAIELHTTFEQQGQVGDDAWLTSQTDTEQTNVSRTAADGTQSSGSVSSSTSFGQAPGGGSATLTGHQAGPTTGSMPASEMAGWQAFIRISIATMSALALNDAQEQWRGGKCIRLESTETGRDVDVNERVPFTVKVFHKIDGGELDKPVVATLAGDKSVNPDGTEQRAPASITYVAPAQPGGTAVVTARSTSNRGIGWLDIRFRAEDALVLELEIDSRITVASLNTYPVIDGEAKVFGRIRLERNPADGTWRGTGTLVSTTTSGSGGCNINTITGTGSYDWVVRELVVSPGIAPEQIMLSMDSGPVSEQPDRFSLPLCRSATLTGTLNTWENLFFGLHNADYKSKGLLIDGWSAGSGIDHWGEGFEVARTTWTGNCADNPALAQVAECSETTSFRIHSVRASP